MALLKQQSNTVLLPMILKDTSRTRKSWKCHGEANLSCAMWTSTPMGTQPLPYLLAAGPSGIISGILLLDRGGRKTAYIDTGRYWPTHAAIAPDGSIWTLVLLC